MLTTLLPPGDGENNSASAEPPGLPPGDATQMDAERFNGVAMGLPAPLPALDGEAGSIAIVSPDLFPNDAEHVAEQRFDAPPNDTEVAAAPPPPSDSAGNLASELPTSLRLSDAEQIAATRLDGAAEGSLKEALAIAPVDAVLAVTWSREQSAAQSTLEPPTVLPPFTAAVEAPSTAIAELSADGPATPAPVGDLQPPADEAPQAAAATAALGAAPPEPTQPLTSALDAAAKLAADANAAAQALESLQRLLERQLPGAAPATAMSPQRGIEQWRGPPPLTPQPLHASSGGFALVEAPSPQLPVPAPQPQRRMPAERIRLDVRGFLAGFALSWAFGIVFYLFMTAG
jgi:hypothetical protein